MNRLNIMGWGSILLNLLVFIYIIMKTLNTICFNKSDLIATGSTILIAIIVQVLSTVEEFKGDEY